jgi:hypothetical protein
MAAVARAVQLMRAKGAGSGAGAATGDDTGLPPVFLLFDVDALTNSFLAVQRDFT